MCYDKAQISIHPMVLHYRDEYGYMKVFSFVGLSGIMAHSVPSTFAFRTARMLELHNIMPLLNTIHFVTDCQSSQYRNSSICALFGQAQLTRTPNSEVYDVSAELNRTGFPPNWRWLENNARNCRRATRRGRAE